jgi:hypothetical protein
MPLIFKHKQEGLHSSYMYVLVDGYKQQIGPCILDAIAKYSPRPQADFRL